MDLVYTTMLIYLGINALGLVWTAGIIQFGVPEPEHPEQAPQVVDTGRTPSSSC